MATSGLDLDSYFAAKRAAVTPDKLAEIANASRAKTDELERFRVAADRRRAEMAAEESATKNSWVGKLGLDPGSFTANRVNDAASLVSGTGRLAGHVASLPVNALSAANTAGMPQEAYDAYNRSLIGKPLEGDAAILDKRESNGLSVKEKFENAVTLRGISRSINDTTDLTKIVEQTNRNSLNKDLGESFDANWGKITSGNVIDTLTGLGGLVLNTGEALITNPSAVREHIVENAPQLLVGALGKAGQAAMAASNAGYAADTYSQGFENYQKKNGGQLPSQEWRNEKSLQAAALALAEQGGDMAGLALAGLKKKAAAELVKTSFKESIKNVAKAGSGAFATEAITEGIQTHLEGEILGKPATAKDIYIAGAIGGASGAGLSGGVRAVAEMSGNTTEQGAVRAAEASAKDKLATAAHTGDVTSYADPASKDYHPGKAIEALYKHSAKADTTPEQRQTNTDKAEEIVSGLQDKRDTAANTLALATIAGTKKAISGYEASIAEMAATDPDRPGMVAALGIYQENLADLETKKENPVAVKAYRESLSALELQLEQATKNKAAMSLLNNGHSEVTDLVSAADIVIETEAKTGQDAPAAVFAPRAKAAESVNKLITLSMASPNRLSAAQATQLADNTANALTPEQRTYLRAFSESRIAENTLMSMDAVSQQIYQGGSTNVGMAQHRAALRAALTAGKQKDAAKSLQTLEKFAQSHVVKAALGKSSPKGAQILRDKQGEWFVLPSTQPRKSDDQMRENGGYTNNSPELVSRIGNEATALAKMVAAGKAAYAIKFDTTTGADNVPNTTQREPAKDVQGQAKAAKTTKAVEPSGKQGAVVSGSVDVAADVGTNGKVDAVKEAAVTLTVFHGSDRLISPRKGEAMYVTSSRGFADSFNPLNKGHLQEFSLTLQNPYYVAEPGEIDGIKYSKKVLAKLKADRHDGVIFRGGKGQPQQALVFDASVLVSKEAPASSVVAETAKETEVTQSTEKTEVNSTPDKETELEQEDRLELQAAAVNKARQDKVTDLDRRIALLEAIKKCMGG